MELYDIEADAIARDSDACADAAEAAGYTLEQAEACEACELGCDRCPFVHRDEED